jgi:hypothetical protein
MRVLSAHRRGLGLNLSVRRVSLVRRVSRTVAVACVLVVSADAVRLGA